MEISGIIVGAGKSRRFGSSGKVFLKIKDIPVIYYSIEQFLKSSFIKEVIVVLNEDNLKNGNEYANLKKVKVIKGGETRAESVREGVKVARYGFVLIHDAVRPLITGDFIQSIVSSYSDDIDGVIPGIDVKYTIKEKDNENFVKRTLPRHLLVEIQTPQLFKKSSLEKVYNKFSLDNITDEAMLIERSGGKVKIVKGLEENIKITTPLDLLFIEGALTKRKK
ncbi:MAG: 2-C-methyl-D-erythritol 4-phosphate cytidylyltransferase [Caldiserica bacterium]|jgi:2-C-methyl-D-erythritol 4-phosphate cytidylyltransferase|nr:2-C-methyl-D-erythritol 4-phosphate cytidylyltransferase [Caldisericota bacterium]